MALADEDGDDVDNGEDDNDDDGDDGESTTAIHQLTSCWGGEGSCLHGNQKWSRCQKESSSKEKCINDALYIDL